MSGINIRDYLHTPPKEEWCRDVAFNQDQRDEILEAFMLYDKDGDGLIGTKDLGPVIRSLGQILTVCEETDIVAQFHHEHREQIDYMTFLKLMRTRYKMFDEDNELRESFRRFDKEENGYVNAEELKKMLTTIGEPLTEEEANEWLEDGKNFSDGGKLYYEDFATFMLSK